MRNDLGGTGGCCLVIYEIQNPSMAHAFELFVHIDLMTCGTFLDTASSKEQVPQESPHAHSQHDPAIIRHEQQPERTQLLLIEGIKNKMRSDLHDEERIKHLNAVQRRFDESAVLFRSRHRAACDATDE